MGKKKNGMDRKTTQINLDFRPGLLAQFPDWHDLIVHVVYSSNIKFEDIAGYCDLAPSQLHRMLNKTDDLRHLPDFVVIKIIERTKDHRPIYWLIERFLEDKDAKRDRAKDELVSLMAQIKRALEGME